RVWHALRSACDAVLVGVGTVVADDPRLTVRMVDGPSPIRVVVDSTLRAPLASNVFDGDAQTVVVTTDRSSPVQRMAVRATGAGLVVVKEGAGGVHLDAALRELRANGVRSLM